MSDSVAAAAVDLAFASAGDVDIGFFGGEPLIAWPRLVSIAEHARARAAREGRRLRLSVTTNATLLTRQRVRRLTEIDVEVHVSLDGDRAAHDATRPARGHRSSFERVLGGIEALRSYDQPLDLIAVVAPANVRRLAASVGFLIEQGARSITLNPAYECPWTEDDLAAWETGLEAVAQMYAGAMRLNMPIAMPTFDNKLFAAAKGGLCAGDGCDAGDGEIAVAPSGRLYPCARLVGEDRDPSLAVGDVQHGVDLDCVRAIRSGAADPACEPCAERWRCTSACMCANLAETGSPTLPGGVQCWHEQTTARIADRVGAELLAERCQTFLEWVYGPDARGIDPSRVDTARSFDAVADTGVRSVARRRHLPIVKVTA